MAEYKLTFGLPDPIVVDSLPLSNWTIVNTDTLSINGDTITQLGIGGWYESMFVSFTVPESGSYKISYDYNITTAKVGNHGTYGFGLWLTTNNPNVSGTDQSNFYNNAANRTGSLIGEQNEDISGKHGTVSFNANLNAGTTYYLWYPGAALDDGTTYTLTFTNIRIYNNPIKYNYNNLLVFPSWNGYVSYGKAQNNVDFSLTGINNQVKYYAELTYPDTTTGVMEIPTGSTAGIMSSVPVGTIVSGYISANAYYRTTIDTTELSDFVSSRTTADPRKVSFSGICNSASHIGSTNTQQNKVVWTWTFNNNNKPTWNNNNGGIYRVNMTPNTGRLSINSCYNAGSAYCCRLLSDQYNGSWVGNTSKTTASTANASIPSTRIAATYSQVWQNVWQSAHIAMTGYAYHSQSYWYGTAANGGQCGLKANYLVNSNQGGDPGKNIRNDFYKMHNTSKTTAFNVTGTGTNMAAANWNNQTLSVYATLGNVSNGASYASKVPPNQITSITATIKCSALMP